MTTQLSITIPSTSESLGPGKPFTLYHILWRLPLRSATVKKRYNDFLSLHNSLISFTGVAPPLSPPKKHYFGSTVGNPNRTEERRAALEAYLNAILNAADSRWRDSAAWRSFLALPAALPSVQQPGGALPSGPITEPTQWLDSHREMKTLLHDARMWLSKRDAASAVAEQHEASAAAKRCLVKASALISALDAGLKKAELLEGEVRRRRDLVAAARQDRDALEDLANSLSAKRRDEPTSGGGKDRSALFAGARGGRVLGAPLPETETTRELDNEGVLQLQKQIIQQQDQGVDSLLKIVQRQKQMGVAIGEELDLQTKMLEQLGEDVDRVDKKTRVARKRADKIS
jgi:regulator of vacuolar morphogenesis